MVVEKDCEKDESEESGDLDGRGLDGRGLDGRRAHHQNREE